MVVQSPDKLNCRGPTTDNSCAKSSITMVIRWRRGGGGGYQHGDFNLAGISVLCRLHWAYLV